MRRTAFLILPVTGLLVTSCGTDLGSPEPRAKRSPKRWPREVGAARPLFPRPPEQHLDGSFDSTVADDFRDIFEDWENVDVVAVEYEGDGEYRVLFAGEDEDGCKVFEASDLVLHKDQYLYCG